MALDLKPEQEKALLALLEQSSALDKLAKREKALPKLRQAREAAEAALAAAEAAAQNERIQVETSAQALISEVWQRHAPAITAARAAVAEAKAAEDAAKLGAVEVKP